MQYRIHSINPITICHHLYKICIAYKYNNKELYETLYNESTVEKPLVMMMMMMMMESKSSQRISIGY